MLTAMHPVAGLCMVTFNFNEADLIDDLMCKFPDEPIAPGPADAAQVLEAITNPGQKYQGKIYLKGTPFQTLVWNALCDIPAGHRLTYGVLAALINRPKAVRAVAMACRANSLAVIVPCHRVVGLTSIGGYRWGEAIKAFLIGMECHDHNDGGLDRRPIPESLWDEKFNGLLAEPS